VTGGPRVPERDRHALPSPRVLVTPLGGTVAAPCRAIQEVGADRVAFLVSAQTRGLVDDVERELGRALPWKRLVLTPDPQDLSATYRAVAAELPRVLAEWGVDWGDVAVDLTGGTKVMVAALVLATIHRATRYVYVGGDERDREGAGVVIAGRERPIQSMNPWEELGNERLRRIGWAFNRLQFAAAAALADDTAARVAQDRRAYFGALARMIEGFAAWDRFDYQEARPKIERSLDTLALEWGHRGLAELTEKVRRCLVVVTDLAQAARPEAPTERLLRDLLSNAHRRGQERRYDDAVARLYRFIEGVAQCALWEEYGIRTSKVPVEEFPEGEPWERLRSQARADRQPHVEIGLLRAYELLERRGHALGALVSRLQRRGDFAGLLAARNQSLLAHGVVPVGRRTWESLFDASLGLVGWTRSNLTAFPRLPED
jgi:CRISPR-associated protein (TIGR02710 family)